MRLKKSDWNLRKESVTTYKDKMEERAFKAVRNCH